MKVLILVGLLFAPPAFAKKETSRKPNTADGGCMAVDESFGYMADAPGPVQLTFGKGQKATKVKASFVKPSTGEQFASTHIWMAQDGSYFELIRARKLVNGPSDAAPEEAELGRAFHAQTGKTYAGPLNCE